MCQLINGPLAADEILKVWDQVFQTLSSVVPLESARAWRDVDPLADPPATSPIGEPIYETFGSEHRRLRAWIPRRVNFIRQEITRLGVQCDDRLRQRRHRQLHLPRLRQPAPLRQRQAGPPASPPPPVQPLSRRRPTEEPRPGRRVPAACPAPVGALHPRPAPVAPGDTGGGGAGGSGPGPGPAPTAGAGGPSGAGGAGGNAPPGGSGTAGTGLGRLGPTAHPSGDGRW